MNLRAKLSAKTTATATIISNTKAIFSDECSNQLPHHSIVEAKNREELRSKLHALTKARAALTRFKPCLVVFDEEGKQFNITYETKPVPVNEDYTV